MKIWYLRRPWSVGFIRKFSTAQARMTFYTGEYLRYSFLFLLSFF